MYSVCIWRCAPPLLQHPQTGLWVVAIDGRGMRKACVRFRAFSELRPFGCPWEEEGQSSTPGHRAIYETGLMAAMEPRQGWPVVRTEHAADTTVTIVRSGTRQIHRRVGVSSGGRVEGGGVQHLLGKRDSYLSDAAMQRRGPGVWGFVAGMG